MPENEIAPRPEKKGLGGCMVAVIVGVGLLLTAAGIIAWLIFWTPQGKQTVAFARASAEMMMRAAQAPGTSELKRSLCRASALVLDLDEFHALRKMLDASQGPSRARLQVICVPENAEPVPSCSDVARAWLNAVGSARGEFEVVVKAGGNKAECAELYSASGEHVGEGHANP